MAADKAQLADDSYCYMFKFYNAIEAHDLPKVKFLLDCGVDVNYTLNCRNPVTGLTSLSLAVHSRAYEIASFLLSIKCPATDLPRCDVDSLDRQDCSALHHCVRNPETTESMAFLRRLLSAGCYMNQINSEGYAPVHIAVQLGHLQYLEELLKMVPLKTKPNEIGENFEHPTYKQYCNVQNLTKTRGDTALHLAAINKDTKAMGMLISAGIGLDICNWHLMSSLHICCKSAQLEACQLLLKKGACPNSKEGETAPLHIATSMHAPEFAKLLLAYGASVNVRDSSLNTPLHIATRLDNPSLELVKLLLANGASANICDSSGRTPLRIATGMDNHAVEFVKVLLANGASVNVCDSSGLSPLFEATSKSDLTLLDCLLQAGGLVNIKDKYGDTPLQYCLVNSCRLDAVLKLVGAGAELDELKGSHSHLPIMLAIDECNVEAVGVLIEAGSQIRCHVDNKNMLDLCSLTMMSCRDVNACLPIARLLLQHGVDPDSFMVEDSPLHGEDFWDNSYIRKHPYPIRLLCKLCQFVRLLVRNGCSRQTCHRLGLESDRGHFAMHPNVMQLKFWLHHHFSILPSLAFCCRKTVRKQLASVTMKSTRPLVQQLPLPQKLKEYILHVDVTRDKRWIRM